MTSRLARWLAALAVTFAAAPASAQLGADAQKSYDDARAAFAASGVQALVIAEPQGFTGHGAAGGNTFPRKFGACIHAFIETGARQPPCS